ncbi:MAG: VIT domain-containing protein, partial [Candidatus Bipolaricaulota bacterium]
MRRRVWWFAAVALVCALANPVLADGIVIPDHPTGWLTIVYHRVTVTLRDGVAKTRVDQAFRNDTRVPVEGTYVFPLSPGAVVEGFTLWVNGKPVAGEVLPADQAREIYLSYLRQSRDPALLEYVGRDAFRARVFPIAPGETRRIELEYTELLIPDAGMFRYAYPLAIERFSARPIEEVRIEVDLAASYPLGSVYAPSHPLTVALTSPSTAHGIYLEKNVLPKKDFVLYYAFSETLVGADLITYKVGEEDGWFLLLIAPPPYGDAPVIPKDLVLVLDRSGSMEGVKMDQAKEAARFILEHLGPEDRFGVITFNETVAGLTEGLTLATPDRVAKAVQAVGTVSADGWTNIHDALCTAMKWFTPGDRPQYVIFLTDGLATRGPTDTATIVRDVTAANATGARLFAFGVGYDVDTHLLDLLAQGNRGTTTYVKPDESLERALSSFYRKIAEPALTDLALTVDGVVVWDQYPRQLPDLFYGGQITLVGRYTGSAA